MTLFINFLNKFSKKKFFIFFCLGLINSFIEIIGISLLIPVFDILLNNEINPIIKNYINFVNISFFEKNYLVILIFVILFIYFFKFIISIIIIYFNQLIIEDLKIFIQKKVIRNYFKRSLIAHNEDSIAVQIRMITNESNAALYAINNFAHSRNNNGLLNTVGFLLRNLCNALPLDFCVTLLHNALICAKTVSSV